MYLGMSKNSNSWYLSILIPSALTFGCIDVPISGAKSAIRLDVSKLLAAFNLSIPTPPHSFYCLSLLIMAVVLM